MDMVGVVFVVAALLYVLWVAYERYTNPLTMLPSLPWYCTLPVPGSNALSLVQMYGVHGYTTRISNWLLKIHALYGANYPMYRTGHVSVLVWDPELATRILTDRSIAKCESEAKILAPGLGGHDNLLLQYQIQNHHTRRRLMDPCFSTDRLRELASLVGEVTGTVLGEIDHASGPTRDAACTIDIQSLFNRFTVECIGHVSFGGTFDLIDTEIRDPSCTVPTMARLLLRMASLRYALPFLKYMRWLPLVKRTEQAYAFLRSLVQDRIDQRNIDIRASPSNVNQRDALTRLLTKKQLGSTTHLDHDTVFNEALTFLMAGSETTSTALGWLLFELLRHPECMARATAEALTTDAAGCTYLTSCIHEALRLHPPAMFLISRESSTDIEYGGYTIPKGTRIKICAPLLNIHERFSGANPMAFDPCRYEKYEIHYDSTFSFGKGHRRCIGKQLAIIEIRTLFHALLRTYTIYPAWTALDAPVGQYFITQGLDKLNVRCVRKD